MSLQRGEHFGNWMNDRCGKLTGSRMSSAMAYLKPKKEGGEKSDKAERKNLKIEILAERMTGDIVTKYTTAAMQWGTDTEPLAKDAYEAATGRLVREVGFVDHPTIENLGASPDGLVGEGLIEIKCPTTSTHLNTILDGVVPTQHYPQMTLQCLVTGREWCDFVSYDPRVDERFRLFVRRFYPTKEQLAEVETEAIQFLAEVDAMFDVLSRMEMVE